ncbi:hypothetical protein Cni_G05979 [Canna indica]|uniref:Uncharacterized protein n=1 Tax=Canna indica TaxID=4628 RepID=A0AAQ3JYU7_9LILI|nr:hypothetical protein Cni_G05979 [Canna indica]
MASPDRMMTPQQQHPDPIMAALFLFSRHHPPHHSHHDDETQRSPPHTTRITTTHPRPGSAVTRALGRHPTAALQSRADVCPRGPALRPQ